MSTRKLLEIAFKGWWARLATGQLKNRRYETFATLEIAEEAFMAGAEAEASQRSETVPPKKKTIIRCKWNGMPPGLVTAEPLEVGEQRSETGTRDERTKAIKECAAIADEYKERFYGPYGEVYTQPEAAENIAKEIRGLLED